MSAQYITLKQSEPEFQDYLWGRIEKNKKELNLRGKRALPVKTYNLGTEEESVTFELINISDIVRPGFFKFTAALIKLKSFILILFPLFFILSKNYLNSRISDPLGIMLAALSSVFLFAGLNIRNDVYDHISGFDRVNLDSNNKPIRMGWISAYSATRLSLLLIIMAAILALPVVLMHPRIFGIIMLALVLFFVGRFAKNNSYKQQRLGEIILFILIGPALVSGFQLSMGAALDNEVLVFGALWGYAVLYMIQVNNFSHLMTSSQSGIKNTMTNLGFDLAQKFLMLAWLIFMVLLFFFQFHYAGVLPAAVGSGLFLLCSLPLFVKISDIKSPMGSGLQVIRQEANRSFLIMIALLMLQKFWFLWKGIN